MKYALKAQSFILPPLAGGAVAFFSQSVPLGLTLFVILMVPAMISLYIPYAKDNPKNLWFKRKLYGWGWTPVTWQGWLATLVYVGLAVLFALTIDENSPPQEVVFTFVIPVVLLTIAFIRVAYKKGESPRWQWGRDGEEKE
jgi:drug/metabolite transporter (DMT)-like permease